MARANDEEDEDTDLIASEENSKSLSSAAACARAAADATATRRAPSSSSASEAAEGRKLSPLASLAHAVGVLHRFSRPHTMIGTTISILSVSAMALVRAEARGKQSEENGRENMRLAMESRLNFKKKKLTSTKLITSKWKNIPPLSLIRPRPTSPRASSPPSRRPSSLPC